MKLQFTARITPVRADQLRARCASRVTGRANRFAVRLDTARRLALSLPETTEEPHFDMSSLLRRAKLRRPSPFFPGDSTRLQCHMRLHPWLAQWLDASPGRTGGSGRSFHFRNDELLEEAWRAKAPKRVLAAYDASR